MEFKKSSNIFTKGAILLTISMLVISSFLFLPQKAQAQFIVTDIAKSVWDAMKWAWDKGGAVAYRNALNFFLQQAAQQTGEWLATGDEGKKPAFLTDPDFYTKVGDQMLGEFVDSVADDFLGQSLCDTLDPTIKFNILANLDPDYQKMKWAEEPECSFSQIKKNLEEASKKQLFEFSTEVKEGKVAKQEAAVSTLIQGDSILTRDIKNFLDGEMDVCPVASGCPENYISWQPAELVEYYYTTVGMGARLHKLTQDFESILGKLHGEDPAHTEDIIKSLGVVENDIEKKVLGSEEEDLSTFLISLSEETPGCLKSLNKWSSECSNKSGIDLCADSRCLLLGDFLTEWLSDNPPACEDIDKTCLSRIKRINKYVKQLMEWTTTLQDMTNEVIENWKAKQGLPDLDPLQDAENMLNPESNAMGIQMELENKLLDKQMKAIEKSKVFRSIQGSMNAVTSKVSGLVKLPSTIVSEKTRKLVDAGDAGPLTYTGVALADAIGVFANTFISQYMKALITKGLNPAADSSRVVVPDDENQTPNADMTSILSEIKVIPINQSSNEMSIYDEFAVCPTGTDQKYTSQFNCLLDNKLARAVEERMTIQEAMDKGLLNPEERLGVPADDTIGLLSKSHIQKLRLIGIVPLGMQIASDIIIETHTNGITLAEVVEGFDQRGANGICGDNDSLEESDFCNLVDPNWVLKAPSYLCELTGYSAIPLRDSSFRQESCLDLKTCINENEGNQCDTWSYCTREKNIWRFGGDECDAQYNTCASYTQKDSKEVFSYLSDTLGFDDCSASNVGCKWYCSKWDQKYSGINGDWSCLSPGWRKYTCYLGDLCDDLNGCDCVCEGDNGCPDGLGNCSVTEGGMSCSLEKPELRNVAFFSNHIDSCKEIDEGCSQYIRIESGLGVNFLPNGSFELPSQDDNTPFGWQVDGPIQQITPSFNAQHNSNVIEVNAQVASACELSQVIDNVPLQGNFIVSGYYKKNGNLSGNYNLKLQICYDDNCSDKDEAESLINFDNNNWKYVSVFLSSNVEKIINHIKVFAFNSLNFSGDIYIDAMQLRNEVGQSVYREYGSKGIVYLKSAPEWMNCYDGDESNNDVDCESFIQRCDSKNVGCELYAPVDDGFAVPAIINSRDSCEIDCLGYETFQERPTNFDTNQRLVDLIPSTAQKCSAPGCEEFTNLDALTQGGEGREYYTYLRQCIKTDAQGMAIVDSIGNEISPASADTCQYYYTWVGEETNGYQLKKYYLEANPSLGGPTQVSVEPNPDWGLCDENHLDNPHCRQFYDALGNIYYRLYKNTITCSPDCSPYRRVANDALYMAVSSEGEVCNASNVDCREYKGAAYGNMKNLFFDRFISSSDPWENVEISEESINRLGQSIRADNNVAQRPVDDLITSKGKVYSLSLWVKGSGDYIASFGNDLYFINEGAHNVSVVSGEWQEIRFGSIYFNREPETDETLIIQGPNRFYLDNITLNEIQDNVYLIKDSWNTPLVCDLDFEGNVSPGYMLGCQAYWDRGNNVHYLKSFSRLCLEKAVGCEAMIDTQNSASPFREEFNSGSPQGDEVIVPGDGLIYRIYDTDKSCAAENKGCQRFGLPELDSNQEAIDFTDVYLLNNPDLYELKSTLCDIEGEGCQEYEGQIYFKEPKDNICEYRENVFLNGENKNGWFRKGTDHPCYMENGFAYQPYGSVYGIRANNDSLYEGMVGVCPENQDGCTQFINPVEQNLVLNSGFELDENGDGVPDNWDDYAPPAQPTQFSLESTDCLSGNCWRVNHDIGDDISAGRQYITIQPGSVYELSVWMKTSDNSDGVSRIYLAYNDIDGQELSSVFSEQLGSTEGKWTKHTVKLTAPYSAVLAMIKVKVPEVDGLMDLRIDNVSLIEQFSPRGSYYYLNNGNIDRTSCNFMVGLKEGCVLFNDTSLGSLLNDSASTYALSQIQGDVSVTVSNVSGAGSKGGDSNVVIKVRRDRVCGEWLQCSGYRSVWDSSIDGYRTICDSWVRCDQLVGSGKQAQCGHIVYDPDPNPLTEQEYKSRNVSWSGMDYSGYSILNMYPIEKLFPSEDATSSGLYNLTYFDNNNNEMGVDGAGLKIGKTTRIYPEKSSPFKNSVSEYYNKVNLCDSGEDDNIDSLYPDCQGSYQKVEYGDQYSGLTKYYNFDKEDVSSRKACKYSGKSCGAGFPPCEGTDECVSPSKITKVIGLRGFCLELDESKPDDANACITWWPGITAGDMDVYNTHYSAGYAPVSEKSWYCASEDSNPIFGYSGFEFYCGYDNSKQCYHYSSMTFSCPASQGPPPGPCIPNPGFIQPTFSDVVDVTPGHNYYWCKTNFTGSHPFSVNLIDDYDFNQRIKQEEIEAIEIDLMGNDDAHTCTSNYDNEQLLNESNDWFGCGGHDGQGADNTCDHIIYGCTCEEGGGCINVRAVWDSDDYLEGFEFCCKDDSASSGASCSYRDIDIYLKNGCRYLINAVPSNNDGLSIAYTDRLWEFSDYYSVENPPETPGTGGTECIPYGVANITAPGGRLTFVSDDPAPPNPYQCESNKANIVYNQNGLQQLFVKVDNGQEFDKGEMKYNLTTNDDWKSWDLTYDAASPADVPKITSIFGTLNAVSIGEYDSGVGPELSPYVANLKFYAWANTNHMPIREISIDWDDDTPTNFYNVISKNHRSSCDQPGCGDPIDPLDHSCWEFGLTPEACVDKYFSFNHTYTCEGEESTGWEIYSGCIDECCFQPKVYIKDNWGWCAGVPGIYAGWNINDGSPNRCSDETLGLNAGISYNGLIKVKPGN